MGCTARYEQLHNVETALREIRRLGILEVDPAFRALQRERAAILGRLGMTRPKVTLLLGRLIGLSPGEFRTWFDTETGWMAEARAGPWADPVYHMITAEEAVDIIKGEVSAELEQRLLTPTTYVGEE